MFIESHKYFIAPATFANSHHFADNEDRET